MKTLYRSTCALSGQPVRLVCDRDAFAVVIAGESIGCGFDYSRALSVFASVADGASPAKPAQSPSDALSALPRPKAPPSRFARLAASAALAFGLLALTSSAAADEPRTKRPTVCASGEPVKTAAGSFFLCTDSKRPKLLARWAVVTFEDEAGKAVRYVIGWPQAAK